MWPARLTLRPTPATLLLALLAAVGGCSPTAPAPGYVEPGYEAWDAVYISGAKVGHSHVAERTIQQDDQTWLVSEEEGRLELKRFGQNSAIAFGSVSWMTPDGRLDHFESHSNLGGTTGKVQGRVEGGELVLESSTGGQTRVTKVPWSNDLGGFDAVSRSLREKPMQPGERRSLRSLMPLVHVVGETTMIAHELEPTTLPTGTQDLLRIEVTTKMPQGQTTSELWTDAAGETLKLRSIDGLATETVRTTAEVALAPTERVDFDLGLATSVPLGGWSPAGPDLHRPDLHQATYRVTLADGNPAEVFASDAGQQIESVDEHTALVTVRPVRPADDSEPSAMPDEIYRRASSIVETDDPRIIAAAAELSGSERDPWTLAQRSETFVYDTIENKNFSYAFASAADALASKQGDCTEHAVLLAALARACGIPSRGAMGLVLTQLAGGKPMLAFHMWTEVYVDGRWLALDATLGRGGIGVDRLKIATTALEGDSAYAAFLPILQAMGKLKIELVAIE